MLPNLVILGAMKCGTSSLRFYLDAHPEIAMAPGGLNFFLEEYNWSKGIDWYSAQFSGSEKIHGDCSPRYTNYPLNPGGAERMAKVIAGAHLIYLVRDPIERIVSHYRHYVVEGLEDRPFAAALADFDRNPYLCRSLYHAQLEQYLAHYPRTQLLVLFHEDLRDRRRATLQRVFRFLEVDDRFESPAFDTRLHVTDEKLAGAPVARPSMPEDLERRLEAALRPDGDRLSDLLQIDLSHWYSRREFGLA